MKKIATSFLLVVVSFILGMVVMGVLAMRASDDYLEEFKGTYSIDQELSAARASKNGNAFLAAAHYMNLVDASVPSKTHVLVSTRVDVRSWDLRVEGPRSRLR